MTKRTLNVVQLISSLKQVSGAVKTLYLLSVGLAEKGHKVTVVSYVEETGATADWLRAKGIDVRFLGKKDACLSRLERYKLIFRLRGLLEEKQADVIHAHHHDADCFCAMAGLFNKRVKKIVTVHSHSYLTWARSKPFLYKNIVLPAIDHFICVSGKLKDEVTGAYPFLSSKTSVIPNAPAPEFFAPENKDHRKAVRARFNVSEEDFLIGTIGNYSKIKGIEALMEAFNKITDIPFKAMFVGSDYEDRLESFHTILERGGSTPKVIFTGYQEDIPPILDAMDLFVLPSLTEADPWVLSEAMAKGKIVIATNVGGIPEKVTDKRNGFLVPPDDPRSLAEAIRYVYENRPESAQAGCQAREDMKSGYSYNGMIQQHQHLY